MAELRRLEDFNIYLLDNSRSRAYLQLLVKHDLLPAHIYVLYPPDKEIPSLSPAAVSSEATSPDASGSPASVLDTRFFMKSESVFETLARHRLGYTLVRNVDLNSLEVIEVSKVVPGKFTIYSGGTFLFAHSFSFYSLQFSVLHCSCSLWPGKFSRRGKLILQLLLWLAQRVIIIYSHSLFAC